MCNNNEPKVVDPFVLEEDEDAFKAKKDLWRIPEATLIGIAVIGGSLGSLLGMYTVRHKTRHLRFTLGIPVILAVQLVVLLVIF